MRTCAGIVSILCDLIRRSLRGIRESESPDFVSAVFCPVPITTSTNMNISSFSDHLAAETLSSLVCTAMHCLRLLFTGDLTADSAVTTTNKNMVDNGLLPACVDFLSDLVDNATTLPRLVLFPQAQLVLFHLIRDLLSRARDVDDLLSRGASKDEV